LNKSGMEGKKTYIIDNFQKLIAPFAETLDYFPVEKISIITGTEGNHGPISAIHPNAIDMERNKVIAGAISEALRTKELNSGS
jgi:flotillin